MKLYFLLMMIIGFTLNAMQGDEKDMPLLRHKDEILKQKLRHPEWSIYTQVYRYNHKDGNVVHQGDLRSLDKEDLIDIRIENFIYLPEFRRIQSIYDNKIYKADALFLGVTNRSYYAFKNIYCPDEPKKK